MSPNDFLPRNPSEMQHFTHKTCKKDWSGQVPAGDWRPYTAGGSAWGWDGHGMGGEEQEGGIAGGHRETSGGDEYIYHLDRGMISWEYTYIKTCQF